MQKIIGFIQAKNEYPLFMLSISHALNNGVDEVYLLDDNSNDNSIQGIKKLKAIWKERFHVVFSKNKTFSQENKTNLLIRSANPSIGDWIYVFDADEFLIVKNNQTLRLFLEDCKREDIIRYPVFNWYSYYDFDDSNLENFKKIQYRSIPYNFENNPDLNSTQILNEKATFFDFKFSSKIIFRFNEDAWLSAGSHTFKLPLSQSAQIKEVNDLEAIHLTYLTKKRMINKASQGLSHIKEKKPSWHGWQNQLLYKLQSENKLDHFWRRSSLDQKKDKSEIISDHITFDSRFQDLIVPVIDILQNKNYQNDIGLLEFNNLNESQFPISLTINLLTIKDEKIHNLSSSLTQRTKETEQQAKTINTLNQTLSERNANLQYFISAKSEILNSTSWRVTYPIRLVGDFIKCLKNMVNQKFTLVKRIPYRLLTHEPIWKICKKIGKAAIKVGFSASWIFSIRKRMHIFQQNYPLVQNMIAIDKDREDLNNYLPSKSQKLPLPQAVSVTVIIPVYRGLEETKRCLNSVLRCSGKVPVKILVIDDCTPEPEISSWLETIAASGKIRLLKNKVNQGFVASANLGIIESGNQDVVLLNSDTVVNADWLDRLVCHAYLNPRIGSVTPFSNNATICSWPSIEGGDLLNGISLDVIDEACSVANRGRQVELPTAVGFCMYIRRDCLTEVGLFDVAAFGKGYGEENDFCMRATAIGWKHVLACDTFVYHVGETSFGKNSKHRTTGWEVLIKRHPDYPELVQQHIQADKAASARLAVAAALYKAASKPVILLITHAIGGGVDRHVKDLIDESDQCANLILLNPTLKGIQLSVPQIKGLSTIVFHPTEVLMLVELLKSFGVSRCHIHHWIGNEMDICKLIDSLGVPFDLTIHDYYSICPRINLVRPAENVYCGEPGPGECNTCIADLSTQGITDITGWRNRSLWMFNEAERVICPSEDTKRRIMLYYPHARLMVAPHQFVEKDLWSVKVPQLKKGGRMRILILGVVVIHKGLENLIAAAEINSKLYEFIVLGYTDPPIPYRLRRIITVIGRYEENELNSLLSKADAHAVWFPNICPETYSYTLSSALKAKLPIIAPTLGAFPERLENRPLTWLFDESSDTSKLNKLFEQIHDVLSKQTATDLTGKRKTTTNNFYKSDYFLPHQRFEATIGKSIYSLKRDKFLSILILQNRFSGNISPCCSIRLVQPIDLIGSFAEDILFEHVDTRSVFHRVADILICQRHAFDTVEDVNRLIEHCRKYQIRLVYDLDDDLINIPENHPEATYLRTFVPIVKKLLKAADTVWVSTPALATNLTDLRSDMIVIPNGHDNRLWGDPIAKQPSDKVRIVFMGTATHNLELAFLEPVALELMHRFGNKVIFEIVGVKYGSLPKGMIRKSLENNNVTYPFFVEWFRRQRWDIAVAPLLESSFNACKSAIKLMDYAALRLPIVASRHPEYEAAFGGDHGIIFAENDQAVWIEKLSMLIEAPDDVRADYGHLSWEHYKSQHTLYHQRKFREMQLRNVVA